jgi:hypothetical protein
MSESFFVRARDGHNRIQARQPLRMASSNGRHPISLYAYGDTDVTEATQGTG